MRDLLAFLLDRPESVSSSVVRVSSGIETPDAVRLCEGREEAGLVRMGAGACKSALVSFVDDGAGADEEALLLLGDKDISPYCATV